MLRSKQRKGVSTESETKCQNNCAFVNKYIDKINILVYNDIGRSETQYEDRRATENALFEI